MRIAAISDIHSNVYALDAVLSDIKKRNVDVIVNIGDILYGPIAPKATYDLLMRHEIATIRGNQDRQIYESSPQEITVNPTMQFILDELGSEPLQWMKELPFCYQLIIVCTLAMLFSKVLMALGVFCMLRWHVTMHRLLQQQVEEIGVIGFTF